MLLPECSEAGGELAVSDAAWSRAPCGGPEDLSRACCAAGGVRRRSC